MVLFYLCVRHLYLMFVCVFVSVMNVNTPKYSMDRPGQARPVTIYNIYKPHYRSHMKTGV